MPQKSVKRQPGIRPNRSIFSPASDFLVKYNCRVKYFPDNVIKVTCFSKPIFNPHKVEPFGKEKKRESLQEYNPLTDEMAYKFVEGKTILDPFTGEYVPLVFWQDEFKETKDRVRSDSVKRAIDKAFEIGFANDFQYFITLTLDEKKIDRYSPALIKDKLHSFLSNAVRRKDLKYILFPEYHKEHEWEESPAIHFHGLISGDNLNLKNSGLRNEDGQVIYNWEDWKYGFSTVIGLDGRAAVVYYVTKYITKDSNKIFGKYYFAGGKELKREVPTEYINRDYEQFQGEEYYIPQAKMGVKYKTFDLSFKGQEGPANDG